jgi:hypothetical protein
MASVEIRSAVKRFGGTEVLHGIEATMPCSRFRLPD